ncbi:MAG: hydrogenase maturation protease [Cyanobacteriota bacterium]
MSGLVVGIGNPLRGDDGVGWWLARRAERLRPAPAVRLVQQLTPELAAELVGFRRVLFVAAWLAPAGAAAAGPCLRPLAAATGGETCSHGWEPAQLLALARLLWPEADTGDAWELLLPAARFDHGEGLSPQLRRWLPQAEQLLRQWCLHPAL